MKTPDLDRERSERLVTMADFLKAYNDGAPEGFPRATKSLLLEYKSLYAGQFKDDDLWSLDMHRKKIMDWLPGRLRVVS